MILDDTDEIAAAALAQQLTSRTREERMFAAHRACECDRQAAVTSALNTIRIAVARFIDDDDDLFIAAAPLFVTTSTRRSSGRLRGLLGEPPNAVLLLSLIRDALNHGSRDEEITSVVVDRGLAHPSPGVRLDSVTLLASLPQAARVGLAKRALIDESDPYLRDMLSACAAKS